MMNATNTAATLICPNCGSDDIRPHGLGSLTRATCNTCDDQDFVPIRSDARCAFVATDRAVCNRRRNHLCHQPFTNAQGTFADDWYSHRFVRTQKGS